MDKKSKRKQRDSAQSSYDHHLISKNYMSEDRENVKYQFNLRNVEVLSLKFMSIYSIFCFAQDKYNKCLIEKSYLLLLV